jgi:hypothetical protein
MQFDYSCTGPRLTAHRKPTPSEIRQGYGATHYKEIPVSLFECFIVGGTKKRFLTQEDATKHAQIVYKQSGVICGITKHIKKFIVCPIDGLRYYR